MPNYLYFSDDPDGRLNLARDEWFLDHVGEDDLVLYFYINGNDVIIGKNQNPWKECALGRMEEDGVRLVRRVTGGGAVYHDAGNLNYSFIAGKNRYDKDRLHGLILDAVKSLGIDCCFSGRNDLLAGGRKFSGSAYCTRGNAHIQHGTLLISADLEKLSRYLTVDPRKIRAKGVDSVRSRVCNLSEYRPGLSVEDAADAVRAAFAREYRTFGPVNFPAAELARYEEKHLSRAWVYGETPPFDCEIDLRLPFGLIDAFLSVKDGRIVSSKTYTDANDVTLSERLDALLCGLPFDGKAIAAALRASGDECFSLLAEHIETEGL